MTGPAFTSLKFLVQIEAVFDKDARLQKFASPFINCNYLSHSGVTIKETDPRIRLGGSYSSRIVNAYVENGTEMFDASELPQLVTVNLKFLLQH